jgi:hypothetical protein
MRIFTTICAGLFFGSLMLAGPSFAENQWQHNHQGRVDINHRLRHQNRRIDRGTHRGQLSGSEAQQLHAEDQNIHNQEVQDAASNHGHLTQSERKQIHHEENAEGHQIYQDRH